MKRTACLVAVLSFLLVGCSSSTPDDSTAHNTTPVVTPGDSTPVVTPGDSTPAATGLTCGDVSLDLNPALASGATCEIVPSFDDSSMGNPAYVSMSLEGYPVSGDWGPFINIYPVADFAAMVDVVPGIVHNLEALTIGGTTPDVAGVPFLFNWDSAQFFYAQFSVLPFGSGNGVRYLTGFTQDMGVIYNGGMVYTYQGMTDDGRYWVSAVFPITSPILPDTYGPPDGMTWDDLDTNYPTYLSDIVGQLNDQTWGSFSPSISDLDSLIWSLTIAP